MYRASTVPHLDAYAILHAKGLVAHISRKPEACASISNNSRIAIWQSQCRGRLFEVVAQAQALTEAHGEVVNVHSQDPGSSGAVSTTTGGIVEESYSLLEWPALCRQVAAFASTTMGARRILMSGLPVGRSKVRSRYCLHANS